MGVFVLEINYEGYEGYEGFKVRRWERAKVRRQDVKEGVERISGG